MILLLLALAAEPHLADLRRLTFGGENAEAYWSFDGTKLSLQSRRVGEQCDRIYMLDVKSGARTQVSSGKGATTCSHFLPGDQELIYASTHLGGEACPPRPDHSKGYVWALYKDYDIFRTTPQGLVRLTDTPGYDAEGTVCPKDGSIVFTSVRDGDLELYRMDADGKNVKRLTNAPGYDGGAFFNRDCTKIVWRASRPKGAELDEYKKLLAEGLVKPSKLEIWVANADGSEAQQVTYLDAASFAPYFHPDGKRIIFSSNYGKDPREFELWSVNVDGTGLEQITHSPGFDGFPMFSPDGKWLAFSSNRAAPEKHETDVYVARWVDTPPAAPQSAADRILRDISWLAEPAREGRGVGSKGLDEAGAWIEAQLKALGYATERQPFDVAVSIRLDPSSRFEIDGAAAEGWVAPGYSANGDVSGELAFAGYGTKPEDYAGASGRIALVRRFVPAEIIDTAEQRKLGDIRFKAFLAREKGAKALVVVDWPDAKELPQEARLPTPQPEGPGDAGIPVVVVKRASVEKVMGAQKPVTARVSVKLIAEHKPAFNVIGRLRGSGQGAVLVGAHYDHLGMGGRFSLAPDKVAVHPGADDNASGVAAILEVARELRDQKLQRDVVFVAFSGEESGVLGSTYFVREGRAKGAVAMLNLDMVGRMRGNRLSILGSDSAKEWAGLLQQACDAARVECTTGGDGYGPSDQTPFYGNGAPVVHFFTGAHSDYHKPGDVPTLINAAGAAQVARIVSEVASKIAGGAALTYVKTTAPAPTVGDVRSFGASLGTIPDYAGPPNGQKGVLLSGVRPGGGADKAGMTRGDILVKLGTHSIGSVEDLMYVLNAAKPGETVSAVVLRGGREVVLEATFQEAKRPR